VVLKNRGVRWLLQQGFEPEDIEHEHHLTADGISARADIYANCRGNVAIVEAQTQFSKTNHMVGRTADVGRENGWPVFVAAEDKLHRLVWETATATNSWGNNPREFTKSKAVEVADLPRVDLSDF
jgi:hypothetical protein